MRVVVKLFAGLRERAGTGERRVELSDGATAGDVWSALGLGDEPSGLLYAVNREYAERDRPLADGDEVALIPPVSGGAFRLSEAPLDLAAAVAEVADERAGAIATFVGTTRVQSRGRTGFAPRTAAGSRSRSGPARRPSPPTACSFASSRPRAAPSTRSE